VRLSVPQARLFIAGYSLAMTGVLVMFFLIAPEFLPFNPGRGENVQLIEITLPVFFGYLTSASHFLFQSSSSPGRFGGDERLLFLMVVGPCVVFSILFVALFVIFYFRHLVFSDLSKWYSIILSLLTSTIGIISANIFLTSSGNRRRRAE
jgi:hypothetical protein